MEGSANKKDNRKVVTSYLIRTRINGVIANINHICSIKLLKKWRGHYNKASFLLCSKMLKL